MADHLQRLTAGIGIRGAIAIAVLDAATGRVRQRVAGPNLITNVGLNVIRNRMLPATTQSAPTHMAVGTGATATTPADTTMTGWVFTNVLTRVYVTGAAQVDYHLFLQSHEANGAGSVALREYALYCSDGVTMVARTVQAPITKNAGVALQIVWSFTFIQA